MCCTCKSCRKQCCRIILGIITIFLGLLSLVGGILVFCVNDGNVNDLQNGTQFYVAIFGGLWAILVGILGGCLLPCCCCCCRKTDDRCRTCLLALDFISALLVVVLAIALLGSDIKAYESIKGKYDKCLMFNDDESSCKTEKATFNVLVALFLISAFEFIIGLATVIAVCFKIRRWCRGEPDDEQVDLFRVVEPSRSSHPSAHQPYQMPHGVRPGYDTRYNPHMSPGQGSGYDPRRGRSHDPYVHYNNHGGATYNPGFGRYM
ncbi:uncharacterized protein [Amphiura filiformis]|uniref:uncharacterized protein n=1 Tax=Amphiura filiformis TaxID=82378 RepID=UPI003B21A0C2